MDVQITSLGLETDLGTGRTDPAARISVPKDRISLQLSRQRSEIAMDYPPLDKLPRLADIATHALELSAHSDDIPTAFGFNIELVFTQDSAESAAAYVARKLFGASPFYPNWHLTGGSGQMTFDDQGKRWQVGVAPRFSEENTLRGFLSLNFHIEEPRLPEHDEILESLQLSWKTAYDFVTQLDTRS